VPVFLNSGEYAALEAVCARLIPADGGPGAVESGVVDYIDWLLGAFSFDPPRIWAAGPFSGRHGGAQGFSTFLPLSPLEELAWRIRIEGSLGRPEREFNGPVLGWQQHYRQGLAAVGADFAALSPEEQDARLAAHPEFVDLVYGHACEGMYGAPEYGANRGIGFEGDVQPRGYTDEEVAQA
jgi:hypothetical protein